MHRKSINSHLIAFGIDVLMTISVFVFYKLDKAVKKETLTYIAFAGIILMHGALHYFLNSPIIDCYRVVDEDSDLARIGYLFFGTFTFFLCLLIFGFTYGSLSLNVFVESTIYTGVVVYITKTIGNSQFVLTGLFCVVHPLSSLGALRSDNKMFTSIAGWWFAISTLVGILELSTCASFFRAIGGHFYYDLTLHTSVLLSLPYFVENNKKAKSA